MGRTIAGGPPVCPIGRGRCWLGVSLAPSAVAKRSFRPGERFRSISPIFSAETLKSAAAAAPMLVSLSVPPSPLMLAVVSNVIPAAGGVPVPAATFSDIVSASPVPPPWLVPQPGRLTPVVLVWFCAGASAVPPLGCAVGGMPFSFPAMLSLARGDLLLAATAPKKGSLVTIFGLVLGCVTLPSWNNEFVVKKLHLFHGGNASPVRPIGDEPLFLWRCEVGELSPLRAPRAWRQDGVCIEKPLAH